MPRPEKVAVVNELKDKLEKVQGAVLTDYRGLNVAEITELRKRLREAGVEYKVVKNTLTALACKELGLDDLVEYLEGPTAIAFGYEDPVSPAKIIKEFSKEHKALETKAGLLDGKVLSVEEVENLASLPGKDELRAMVLRGMLGPLTGLVNVLQGTVRNLVYALDAIKRQKEEAGA